MTTATEPRAAGLEAMLDELRRRVDETREQRGQSLAQASLDAGLSINWFARFINGASNHVPKSATCRKMAKYLGCSQDDVLTLCGHRTVWNYKRHDSPIENVERALIRGGWSKFARERIISLARILQDRDALPAIREVEEGDITPIRKRRAVASAAR